MDPRVKKILDEGGSAVFFGGAGVSTESNIPDFRSEAGLYKAKAEYGYPPEYMLSHTFFKQNTELFFDYYKKNLIYRDAEPNAAHKALAKLEAEGKLLSVVTQNIDNLHQKAGSKRVWELHGSVYRNKCMGCGMDFDLDFILDEKNCENGVPYCPVCGKVIKPDVVLYEEPLDEDVIQGAIADIARADVLIVGGTSLAVYPAAGLVNYFKGRNIILINKQETPFDSRANLVIHEAIGQVLGD